MNPRELSHQITILAKNTAITFIANVAGVQQINVISQLNRITHTLFNQQDRHAIATLDELRAVMPAGSGGSCVADALKVVDTLDEQMVGFIERSPFIHLYVPAALTVGLEACLFYVPPFFSLQQRSLLFTSLLIFWTRMLRRDGCLTLHAGIKKGCS